MKVSVAQDRRDAGIIGRGSARSPARVRVEPLDDADPDSFFEPGQPIDIGFAVKYYERLVVVPRGGDSGLIRIAVTPK